MLSETGEMEYRFDFGFHRGDYWLDGEHKMERYRDGKKAFARYLDIQRNGHKAEDELRAKNMLPDETSFLCTVDILQDGEINMAAVLAFVFDAFEILNEEYKKEHGIQDESS